MAVHATVECIPPWWGLGFSPAVRNGVVVMRRAKGSFNSKSPLVVMHLLCLVSLASAVQHCGCAPKIQELLLHVRGLWLCGIGTRTDATAWVSADVQHQ